jgi:SRSO17 transposase
MSTLERLDDYVGLFRPVFRRREQLRWASVYLQGLLQEGERKSVETLAGRIELPADLAVEDAAQALQHFISQSPWDADELLRRYRELIVRPVVEPDGVLVIEDVTFPKQGQHSVGVQRQFSAAQGRKINCQLAVSLHHVAPSACWPLALRLYLPRGWIRTTNRLDASGVPEAFRRPQSRADIALELIDAVRDEGISAAVVVAPATYGSSATFLDGVAQRGLTFLAEVSEDLLVTPANPADSPIEGPRRLAEWRETAGWLPWQRVRPDGSEPLWILTDSDERGPRHILSNLPAEATAGQARALWENRSRVEETCRNLRDDLGLDHFEGRSWMGFHHHASLVLLAHGFRLWEAD